MAEEEWDFVDGLKRTRTARVCMTCQHFTYGVDQHCHTMVGCNLRQKQLQQGRNLKKWCKLWAPFTHQPLRSFFSTRFLVVPR